MIPLTIRKTFYFFYDLLMLNKENIIKALSEYDTNRVQQYVDYLKNIETEKNK